MKTRSLRRIISLAAASALVMGMCCISSSAYTYPSAYWKLHSAWDEAVSAESTSQGLKPWTATARTAATAMLPPMASLMGTLHRGSRNIAAAGSRAVQEMEKPPSRAESTAASIRWRGLRRERTP